MLRSGLATLRGTARWLISWDHVSGPGRAVLPAPRGMANTTGDVATTGPGSSLVLGAADVTRSAHRLESGIHTCVRSSAPLMRPDAVTDELCTSTV